MKAGSADPWGGLGGVQAGHAKGAWAAPTATKASNSPAFTSTSPSCVRRDIEKPPAWAAVSSTTRTLATVRGPAEGTSVRAKWPAASAATAMGAEKPSSSDAQPASVPSTGWSRSERYRYSPPEPGTSRATSA